MVVPTTETCPEVIGSAEGVRTNLYEIESAYRGYVVTADEGYLETVRLWDEARIP